MAVKIRCSAAVVLQVQVQVQALNCPCKRRPSDLLWSRMQGCGEFELLGVSFVYLFPRQTGRTKGSSPLHTTYSYSRVPFLSDIFQMHR